MWSGGQVCRYGLLGISQVQEVLGALFELPLLLRALMHIFNPFKQTVILVIWGI